MDKSIKEKVAFYLDDNKTSTGKFIDIFIISLNFLAVIIFTLETYYREVFPQMFFYNRHNNCVHFYCRVYN